MNPASIKTLQSLDPSLEEICLCLSVELKFEGEKKTPEEIWNSSPTGEIYPIVDVFNAFKQHCQDKGTIPKA